MRRTLVTLCLVALAGAGCADEDATGVDLSRDDFVAAYVALRVAESEAESPADFEARKAEILERYGTSREEMLAFIETHSHDVAYLSALWDSVRVRLESGASPGGSTPDAEGSGE